MLKLADLASRADFVAGPLHVSPARRLVEGPSGTAHVEPVVMKVFLLLLDAAGNVVTRDELFGNAWGGVFVGDASLNRAILQVRKIAAVTAPGLFELETIPRTGYRLKGPIVDAMCASGPPDEEQSPRYFTRRSVVRAGAGAAALLAGGLWWSKKSRSEKRADALVDGIQQALWAGGDWSDPKILATLHEAAKLRPDDARAWGLIALTYSQLAHAVPVQPNAVEGAERSAARALSLNAQEPNALLALVQLRGLSLDWYSRDQALRRIISIDPTHVPAILQLVELLQSAGMTGESWLWNERAIRLAPFASEPIVFRALKLWILERVHDADKVIDQARDLWPTDDWIWYTRFLILATTRRAQAAQGMVDSDPGMLAPPARLAMWRTGLSALEQPSADKIAAAQDAVFGAARRAGPLAVQGVMILGALAQTDAAFAVANGFLLWQGPVTRAGAATVKSLTDAAWRINTQWLFTPPTAVMRADPRFLPLCDGIGLTDYWRKRAVRPDYQRGEKRS
jgi:DNA-binding winged helix-turn-helix (wHTH) protein